MAPFALHLLRHGAPVTPGRMAGHGDVAPSAEGVEACRAQATGLGIDRIVSSDLSRAHAAAAAIGQDLSLPVTVDPRWRELDFGDWDGRLAGEIDSDALAAFWNDPDASPPPGGERWSALVGRVAAALADVPPRTTLVVTHGGAMRAALAHLCGFDQRGLWAFDLPCAALLSLRVWPGAPATAQIVGLYP